MPVDTDRPLRVSVIIPHYNMPDALLRCLASIKAQDGSEQAQIIVVDNASTVSLDAVRAIHDDVTFLTETRAGPGLARNTGVAAASAPVLAFIDADCRAEAGWLMAAVAAVEAGGPRAVVGGDVRIDFCDVRQLTAIEAYEAVFAYRQAVYINKQGFSGTGNLAMAAPVHADVGPFAGIEIAEDLDWGRRATAAGFVTRYIHDMRIYHPARQTFAELQRKWQRHIAHELHSHRAAGRADLRWYLLALAVLGSTIVHAPRLFTSNRLSGFGNRLRGLGILIRIRLWRTTEMWRAASRPGISGGEYWTAAP